ncbi:MAG: hypothetical protein MZW92_72770 [Comamonadaceae bacterium]|nr:hypothetical protein [Comamonadaceae bacterium]
MPRSPCQYHAAGAARRFADRSTLSIVEARRAATSSFRQQARRGAERARHGARARPHASTPTRLVPGAPAGDDARRATEPCAGSSFT